MQPILEETPSSDLPGTVDKSLELQKQARAENRIATCTLLLTLSIDVDAEL